MSTKVSSGVFAMRSTCSKVSLASLAADAFRYVHRNKEEYLKNVASLNVLIILAIALFPPICFSSPQGKIEVKGIRIISDGYGTDIDSLKPFNSFKGTSVSCLAILPSRRHYQV